MSVKQKHHHTPTRICPHRLCLPLHLGVGLIAIIDVIVLLTRGDAGQSFGNISMFWLVSIVIGLAGYAVSRVVLGQSTGQLMRLDRLDRVRGIHLVARPVWAVVAAGTDVLNVVLAGACGAFALAGQAGPSEMSGLDQATMLTGMVITLGIQGFRDFAHRMATKPVKPKRVTVPALVSSSA